MSTQQQREYASGRIKNSFRILETAIKDSLIPLKIKLTKEALKSTGVISIRREMQKKIDRMTRIKERYDIQAMKLKKEYDEARTEVSGELINLDEQHKQVVGFKICVGNSNSGGMGLNLEQTAPEDTPLGRAINAELERRPEAKALIDLQEERQKLLDTVHLDTGSELPTIVLDLQDRQNHYLKLAGLPEAQKSLSE